MTSPYPIFYLHFFSRETCMWVYVTKNNRSSFPYDHFQPLFIPQQ